MMKKITSLLIALMAAMAMNAQNTTIELPDDFTVIDNQPEGQLMTYTRSGGLIREVEKEYVDYDDPYEIMEYEQDGSINFVFAADNKVYIQQPASWLILYDGWVEGQLSEDGKTITVPLGQYTAYTFTLGLATQLWLFNYDAESGTYVLDEETKEIVYTIDDEGVIRLQGTSRDHILGLCQRSFNSMFMYLDYEWLSDGDFDSVYTPVTEKAVELPEGVTASDYYVQGIENDGVGLNPINQTARLAFDGDDVYLSGFNTILPNAWIKGHRDGDDLVFPTDQFLGSYSSLVYFKNVRMEGDKPVAVDMVLTYNGRDAWSSPDYVFISQDRDELKGISFFSGIYISSVPDAVVTPPEGLAAESYKATYGTIFDEDEGILDSEHIMKVGQADEVYIQGFWARLPQAWIKGKIVDGWLVIPTPQLLGEVEVEETGMFPAYLTAFDTTDGSLLPELKFAYDDEELAFTNQSAGISFGVSKAVYLTMENYYDMVFARTQVPLGITSPTNALGQDGQATYDLQGRIVDHPGKGIHIVRMGDGTARKVLR